MNIAIVEDAAQDSQWLQGLLSEYGESRGLALQTEFFSNGEDFPASAAWKQPSGCAV